MQCVILHLGSEVTPTEGGTKSPNTFKQRLDVLSNTGNKVFNICWCYCDFQPQLSFCISLCTAY